MSDYLNIRKLLEHPRVHCSRCKGKRLNNNCDCIYGYVIIQPNEFEPRLHAAMESGANACCSICLGTGRVKGEELICDCVDMIIERNKLE